MGALPEGRDAASAYQRVALSGKDFFLANCRNWDHPGAPTKRLSVHVFAAVHQSAHGTQLTDRPSMVYGCFRREKPTLGEAIQNGVFHRRFAACGLEKTLEMTKESPAPPVSPLFKADSATIAFYLLARREGARRLCWLGGREGGQGGGGTAGYVSCWQLRTRNARPESVC